MAAPSLDLSEFGGAAPQLDLSEFNQTPKPRGFIPYVAQQAKAGITSDLPTIAGKALQYAGATDLGTRLRTIGEANAAENAPDTSQGPVTQAVAGAVRGAAPIVPLAVGGLLAQGTPAGPALDVAGAAALAGGFGGAQAQDTLEKAKAAGLSDEQATSVARKAGGIMSLGMGTVGALTGGVAAPALRALAGTGAKTAGDVIASEAVPGFVRPFAADTAGHLAGNVASMAAANAGTAAVEQQAGLPGPSPGEAAMEGVTSGAGLTAALLPFGAVRSALAQRANAAAIARLQNPQTDPAQRAQVASRIHANLQAVDPDAADNFARHATQAIDNAQPLELGAHLLELGPHLLGPQEAAPEPAAAAGVPEAEVREPAAPTMSVGSAGNVTAPEQDRPGNRTSFAPGTVPPEAEGGPPDGWTAHYVTPNGEEHFDYPNGVTRTYHEHGAEWGPTTPREPTPAQKMGIDATAGPMQEAAALAVDSGAHQANAEGSAATGSYSSGIEAQRALKATGELGKVIRADGGWRIQLDNPEASNATKAGTDKAGSETAAAVGSAKPGEAVSSTGNTAENAQAAGLRPFPPAVESLGIARAEMPQITPTTHGPLTQFLAARGITHEQLDADPRALKPTQGEYDPAKVREMQGNDASRTVLVSSDNYILDGTHQWLSRYAAAEPIKVIRFDAPIKELLPLAKEFPSSHTAQEAKPKESTDATREVTRPTSVPAEHQNGDQGGKTAEAGGGNRVQPAEAGQGLPGGAKAQREPGPVTDDLPSPGGSPFRTRQIAQSFLEDAKARTAKPAGEETPEQRTRRLALRNSVAGREVAPLAEGGFVLRKAAKEAVEKPVQEAGPLRIGTKDSDTEPVTVKDGIVHIGKEPALNYDSGEAVKVASGASDADVKQALKDAKSITSKQKFFGGEAEAPDNKMPVGQPPLKPKFGIDGEALHGGGKPFSNRIAAGRFQKEHNPSGRVVKVQGGFAIRDSSEKEDAARQQAGNRLQTVLRQKAHDENPLKAFVAQHGLAPELAQEFAPGQRERQAANVRGYGETFRKGGLQMDKLAELAAQDGYLPPNDHDANRLYDLVARAMRGERIVPIYAEGQAEKEMQAHIKAQQELHGLEPHDLDARGYDRADPELQARVRELIAKAEQGGIDHEGILEDIAKRNENASTDEFNRQAVPALEAALEAAHTREGSAGEKDRGGPAGGQVPEPQGKAEGVGNDAGGSEARNVPRKTGTVSSETRSESSVSATDARTGEVAGGEGKAEGLTPTAGKTAQGLSDFLGRVLKRHVMEAHGQDILDRMEDRGESPGDVADKFWTDTYFKLPPAAQERFKRMAANHGGDDILTEKDKPSYVLDMPSKVENLEGTERGFVALMKEGNDRFAEPERPALTAPTKAEVLAQQSRKESAPALEAKEQIDREAEKQTLTQPVAPEQRKDTTGDLLGGPTKEEALAAKQKAEEAKAKPKEDGGTTPMFSRGKSTEPFYSALSREVEKIPAKAMPSFGWQSQIQGLIKSGKVKADEVAWTGLDDWLKLQQGKVTREQIGEYLKANGVQVKEVTKGGKDNLREIDNLIAKADAEGFTVDRALLEDGDNPQVYLIERATDAPYRWNGQELYDTDHQHGVIVDGPLVDIARRLSDIADEAEAGHGPDGTKYGNYTLPGGTNYREVLLTLPVKQQRSELSIRQREDGRWGVYLGERFMNDAATRRAAESLMDGYKRIGQDGVKDDASYRSSHWDEPNVLAHIRLNDRTDADGKRVLFVEEIQSDWAQQGKKSGFAATDTTGWAAKVGSKGVNADIYTVYDANGKALVGSPIARSEAEAIEKQRAMMDKDKVPIAPFVGKTDAWVSLALKRIVKMAVDEGYDKVAFVNGEQSAARYDLSKQVNSISWEQSRDGWRGVHVDVKNGNPIEFRAQEDGTVTGHGNRDATGEIGGGKKLADVVGKDVADKIMAADKGNLSGDGIKVGGEGMKAFYDKIVPSVAKDVVRKLGGDGLTSMDMEQRNPKSNPYFGNEPFSPSDARVMERTRGVFQVWVKNANGVEQLRGGGNFDSREAADAFIKTGGRDEVTKQMAFDITPAMREKAAGGLPLFKRAESEGPPLRTPEIRKALAPALDSLKVPYDLHDSAAAAKEATGVEIPADAKGMYFKGKLHLIAEGIKSPLEAEETLWHEVNHAGIDRIYSAGSKDYYNAMRGLTMQNANIREAAKVWLSKFGEADTKGNIAAGMTRDSAELRTKLQAVEEALSELAGRNAKINGAVRFIAKVQEFMRAIGLNRLADSLEKMTDAQALSLIFKAREAVTKEPQGERGPQVAPAFARKENIAAELRRRGEEIVSKIDAERRLSDGDRIFGFHEQDEGETPVEITKVDDLKNWAPDQLIALPAKGAGTRTNKWPDLAEAFERYENGGDDVRDLHAAAEHLLEDDRAPDSIRDAAEKLRTELNGEREYGGRNDTGGAEDAFVRAVEKALGKTGTGEGSDSALSAMLKKRGEKPSFSRSLDKISDRIDALKGASVVKDVGTAYDGVLMATNPAARSDAAKEMARTLIAGMGEKELRSIQFRTRLNASIQETAKATTLSAKARDLMEKGLTVQADKVFLRNKPEDNHAFMQAMDTGDEKYFTDHPELKPMADVIERMFAEKAREIQGLGTGALQAIRENYFPHIWNREPSGDKQREIFSGLAKRPLEGRKGFAKERVFDDVRAGLDAGFEPISNNPLDLVALKMEEMDKYILAHKTLSAMEGSNGVHLIAAGEKTPQGFTDVNGRFGSIERNGEKLRYIARDDVAQVINNYLSPSLYHNKYVGKPFTAYMGVANTLNQFQLGVFSAFHAGFTSMEAVISHAAIGVKALTAGDFKGAAKYLGTAPAAWINNPRMGSKIIAHMMDSAAHPEMAPILQGLQLAGFKWQMDNRFRTDATKNMLQAWQDGKQFKAGLNSIPALAEQTARPILEWLVPRQKFGVFGEMYSKWMQDNPKASHEEMRNSAQQIWNRVDSRLGQVVYDRLFVHNVAKNFAQMLIRAPGWTGGTILEVGGGIKDLASYAKALASGKRPESISDRAAYTLSMLTVTATVNAAMTAMFTGDSPQDWRDLVAFRTGNQDEHGRPERFMLPTYMKDVYAYAKAPGTTLLNKSHPLLSLVGDIGRNKDFYGTEIRSEDSNLLAQLAQTAGFTAKAFVPFWVKGVQKEQEREGSALATAAPLVGVMPAPSDLNKTAAEKLMTQYGADRMPQGSRTQEEADKADLRRKMNLAIRKGEVDKAKELFAEGRDAGLFAPRDFLRVMHAAHTDPLVASFQHLTFEQAQRVMKTATEDEKAKLQPAFARKTMEYRRQHAGAAPPA